MTSGNKKVADSIAHLKDQVLEVLGDFPKSFKVRKRKIQNVVVCGMGGSALAADWLRYALWQELKVPVIIVNNYVLPEFVSQNSLVVVISYSGTTEEALACLQEAKHRKFPVVAIASGKKLISWAASNHISHYSFKQTYNPSRQPRLGLGYSIGSLLMVLKSARLVHFDTHHLHALIEKIKSPKVNASQLKVLGGKSIVIIASEHLLGVAHVMSNQFNETAKTFAPYFALPELNHHLLEGLGSLKNNAGNWIFVFLESDKYHQRIQKRYEVTKAVVRKQGFQVLSQKFHDGIELSQAFQALAWSSDLSFRLADQAGIDATAIPWVDYFKERMKK